MNITGIQNPINTDLLAKAPQAIVDAWKVGQLVNATVASSQKNGQATVNINGALLLAQTRFPLRPGQPLQLEVSSLSVSTVLKVISNTDTRPITVSLQPQGNLSGQLQTGQQLNAVLTRTMDVNQTRAMLELAGHRINVQLSQPLPVSTGQQIKLEVVTPGAIASLKIVTTPLAALPATSMNNTHIAQALRTILPQQAPLPLLLNNLALIVKDHTANLSPGIIPPTTQRIAPLPQPLIELVRAVVDRLPDNRSVSSGDGLKQAVAQSGLFMEARLAQILQQPTSGTTTPPIDFKGGLLSLLLTLLNFSKNMPPPSPTNTVPTQTLPHIQTGMQTALNQQMNLQQVLAELLRNVGSGLARLQLSQLVSSAADEEGKRAWIMEIPVRSGEHIDLIQLRIEKEKNQRSPKKPALWTVTLALELRGLGSVQARVTFADNIVSTHFWAEHASTTELINQHLTILENRYQEVGLTVGALKAHHGTAPDPVSPDKNLPHTLLDEKV
ncbi:MAG: flagellar hook-length control protein FliK [Gammaproteobacteria bacterium]|nr:flagellar hook-length control protein FliK [Gammaproteobacteria bacterium]MCF6261685.1 flagellar hook-length control protein FliK [Gammaproteobacteria bacterium]